MSTDSDSNYKRDFKFLEARRRRGMRMLEEGTSQSAVARELGVSRQTVSCWKRALAEGGKPWQGKQLGRPAGLTSADKTKLARFLDSGPRTHGFLRDHWTLALVGQLIARHFGPEYSTVHVMRLLRSMKYSLVKNTEPASAASRPAQIVRPAITFAVASD